MMSFPFQGIKTFLGSFTGISPTSELVVVGLPFDCGSTFRNGSRFAPQEIRNMSMLLRDGVCEQWPVDLRNQITDLGDIDICTGNTLAALLEIENVIMQLHSSERHVVCVGGDHTVTLGILRGMRNRYPNMACIHLDSHNDVAKMHHKQPVGHQTWLYNAITENLVDPEKTVSIGVRAPCDQPQRFWLAGQGGLTINAREAMQSSARDIAVRIVEKVQNTPCYLTIDISCLDPSIAPGTSCPVVSGLSTVWVEELIDNLHELRLVGMDCVEVNPSCDVGSITSLAAATFCWRYASLIQSKIQD